LKFTQSDFKTVTSNISFISNHKRVVTRTILIPFAEPSIGPTDEEGDEVFAEMEDLVQQRLFSKSIGWIIELGARLVVLSRDLVTSDWYPVDRPASIRATSLMAQSILTW
jgi:hypothetical protein